MVNHPENKLVTPLGALMEVRMGPRIMGSQSLKPSAEVSLVKSLKGDRQRLEKILANILLGAENRQRAKELNLAKWAPSLSPFLRAGS